MLHIKKVKYLNFAITLLSIFFTEISHADRGTTAIKHIKWDFSSKAWVQPVGWTGGGEEGKIQPFQDMVACCISN